jgi:nucleotide-binding universal stress UspA family protein
VLDHSNAPAERDPRETDMFRALDERAVLLAYDGSKPAKASILEAAHRLGSDRCAIVLTVWHPLRALPFPGAASLAAADTERSAEVTATRIAYEGARLARSIGFDARPIAARGEVWCSIVDCADAHDVCIVVLGSCRSAGAGVGFTGSVAAAVARHTTRPVLSVEAPSAEPAASTVLIIHGSSAAASHMIARPLTVSRGNVADVVSDRRECTCVRRPRLRAFPGWRKLTAWLNKWTSTPQPMARAGSLCRACCDDDLEWATD